MYQTAPKSQADLKFHNLKLVFDLVKQEGPISVSYTHLDVYKRQAYACAVSKAEHIRCDIGAKCV